MTKRETSLLIDELSLSAQKAESWKPIPGYEGIYEVSNCGRIRTADGKTTQSVRHGTRVWKQRILHQKLQRRKNGVHSDARVQLYKDKKAKTFLVSRLVALAWCSGYADGLTVNHINGNPMDNSASNLEWVSHADNIRHAFRTGLCSFQKRTSLTNVETGETFSFPSMSKAGIFLGRNTGYINNCISAGRFPRDKSGTRFRVNV